MGVRAADISLIVVLRFILFLFPRAIAVIPKLLKERVIIMPLTKMKSGTARVCLPYDKAVVPTPSTHWSS